MTKTGLIFEWTKGSKNDNAIKLFKDNKYGITFDWRYNKYGALEADFYGVGIYQTVEFKYLHDGVYEIVGI